MSDAPSGNRIAALRAKFAGKGSGFVPTPEYQFGRMKKSKEENVRAVKVAKARAARYNMTLRALAIQTHTDTAKMQRSHITDKKKTRQDNAKFKGTSRGLHLNRELTRRDKNNIARALDENTSPSLAKNVIKAVAKKENSEVLKTAKEVNRLSMRIMEVKIEDNDDVGTDDEAEKPKKVSVKEEVPVSKIVPEVEEPSGDAGDVEAVEEPEQKQKVEMTGMHEALASGDDQALNKAILENFLSSHAPHMAGQADTLLDQFSTQLDVLFKGLLTKFPNEEDAVISGQQKADKEITEAVESGDKEIPAVTADDESEDSFVMNEDEIDKYEENPAEKEKSVTIDVAEFTLGLDDEDDDGSLVEVVEEQDKMFSKGYNKTIRKAEKTDRDVIKSVSRRRTTLKLDATLHQEIEEYKREERTSMIKSLEVVEEDDDDSLIETPANYIVEIQEQEVEDSKEEVAPVRWAVQFENKNYALKKKLLKQGLTEDQVSQLVDNLDSNTSEML